MIPLANKQGSIAKSIFKYIAAGVMKFVLLSIFITMSLLIYASEDQQLGQNDYSQKINTLLETDQHLELLDYIDSLRLQNIYTPELSWQYARSLFQLGRLNQARDSLLIWESDSVMITQAQNMLATIALRQRNHLEAIKYLNKLSERYPENPTYPHRLARAFNAINQIYGAEYQLARAYRLDTLNQVVIREWADILLKMDFSGRALNILNKGIEISPDNMGFRRQKVIADYRLKNMEDVIATASHLTLKGDTAPMVVKLKAFALFQNDSIDKAEFWIDYLLKNDLTGEDVYFYKGKILSARNEHEDAKYYYQEAVFDCLSPNFNPFALQTAINLYELGNYQQSIRWLQMARIFNDNPTLLFFLAENYYDYYEDKMPALTHYQLFLEHSSNDNEEEYREYAKQRIRRINEEMHFEGRN